MYVVDDNAILDAAMDSVSSKKVRDRLKKGGSVDNLVGDTVSEYMKFHKIGLKVIILLEKHSKKRITPVL